MPKRNIAIVVIAVLAVAAVYAGWYWYHPLHPGDDTYEVRPGMTLRAFANELAARGVLNESRTFSGIAKLTGRGKSLKAGEYRFADGLSASALLDQVVAGRVVEYPLVLVEGWTFRQFRQALAQAPRLAQTLDGLTPAQVMERLGHPGEHWEGRFFPDTYYYSAGHTDQMILARAYDRTRTLLASEWEKRDDGLPYRNAYEALIMASIVEKETGKGEERPLIAGVFQNRLRLGMKLQTDPTVIYGLGEKFDGNLRRRDLVTDTPYNTYTRRGLPPTPIAMPGGAAIRAVLHPAATRALYFVSRGDGSHVFTDNLKDHNQAVIKYQLGGKPRAFSSHPVAN
jgi:UPF0755 protein